MKKYQEKLLRKAKKINFGFLLLGVLSIAAGINVFFTGEIGRGGVLNDENLRKIYSILLVALGIATLTFLTKKKDQ
ncbi:hypothetical protein P8S55_14735 [Halomonas sp. M1]|uniref:hypothetical protein n=1 Tax=Halomonas sp. M1 TaxID=3035470 RepID=UPI00248580D7|nr:hypothetical protein [Halomonas sp. M1]WFE71027.1 hypothetical protein P8S55_14735 [Halomonas sp. M1]